MQIHTHTNIFSFPALLLIHAHIHSPYTSMLPSSHQHQPKHLIFSSKHSLSSTPPSVSHERRVAIIPHSLIHSLLHSQHGKLRTSKSQKHFRFKKKSSSTTATTTTSSNSPQLHNHNHPNHYPKTLSRLHIRDQNNKQNKKVNKRKITNIPPTQLT